MPSYFFTLEINAFGLLVLLLMYFNKQQQGIISLHQKFFDRLLKMASFMLIADSLLCIINGAGFQGAGTINLIGSSLYYLFEPMIGFLWLFYCQYRTDGGIRRLKLYLPVYFFPLILNALLVIANFFTGWLYTIDSANRYQAGPIVMSKTVLTTIYIIVAVCLALSKSLRMHTRFERREYNHMALFLLPLIIGGVLQYFLIDMQIFWICVVSSLLMIFVNNQNTQISTDALTGVNNRRQFDKYLELRTRSLEDGMELFAIFIDVDEFKHINDTYGHAVGDIALQQVADILKRVCGGRNDFLARIGGDEFAVICTRKNRQPVENTIDQIQMALSEFNMSGQAPYRLSLSMGIAQYGEYGSETIDDFIASADALMYQMKQRRKAHRR